MEAQMEEEDGMIGYEDEVVEGRGFAVVVVVAKESDTEWLGMA